MLARWHGTALGEQLSHLAEQEWLLNNTGHNLEQQFFDTINRLSAEQTERHIDKLLAKSANQPLSAEEKQQLLDLFGRQRAPKIDS